jgi:hypothetical protein
MLDVIRLHILFGLVEMARAKHDSKEIVGEFFVRGKLWVAALEQSGGVFRGHNGEGGGRECRCAQHHEPEKIGWAIHYSFSLMQDCLVEQQQEVTN